MKFFAFVLAGVGLFQANGQSSIGGPQGNDSLQEEPLNLIKNGNFEYPSIIGNQQYVDFISDWDAPTKIKLSKGEISNPNWGNRYVVELVTLSAKNAYLRQTLNLRQGVYIVTFEYAPCKWQVSSSPMALVWNGRVIENFYPSDTIVVLLLQSIFRILYPFYPPLLLFKVYLFVVTSKALEYFLYFFLCDIFQSYTFLYFNIKFHISNSKFTMILLKFYIILFFFVILETIGNLNLSQRFFFIKLIKWKRSLIVLNYLNKVKIFISNK